MRWILDLLIALMIAGLIAGLAWHDRTIKQEQVLLDVAHDAVTRLSHRVQQRGALDMVEDRSAGFPPTIDPEWFEGDVPENPLLDGQRPWLEIAPAEDAALLHPIDRTAATAGAARFWYNPANGIVRARVPSGVSDTVALEMYNYVNGCQLASIFDAGATTDRPYTDSASSTE